MLFKKEGGEGLVKVASLVEIPTTPHKKYDPSSFKIINIGLPTARKSIRTIFKLKKKFIKKPKGATVNIFLRRIKVSGITPSLMIVR
jgi:hypothetical protein